MALIRLFFVYLYCGVFKAFEEATNGGNGIDVDDVLTYPSLVCFEALGIIAAGRKEEIIQGVPL